MTDNQDSKIGDAAQPPTDRPLTAGDVPLLREGDLLRVVVAAARNEEWDGVKQPAIGEEVVFIKPSGSGGVSNCIVTSFDPAFGYRPGRFTFVSRPASEGEGKATGWLRKAVLHLLPRWGMEGHEVPLPGVRGVPNADHADPRFSVHCYSGHGGNLTVALMIGRDHSRGGVWQEMDFTPEQAVQIAAAILSMPAVEHVAAPLVAALASPPASERERELEGVLREVVAFIRDEKPMTPERAGNLGHLLNKSDRALTAQPAGEGK